MLTLPEDSSFSLEKLLPHWDNSKVILRVPAQKDQANQEATPQGPSPADCFPLGHFLLLFPVMFSEAQPLSPAPSSQELRMQFGLWVKVHIVGSEIRHLAEGKGLK
jgi:hypothetical protein